jgi:hypothetical protein
MILFYFRPWSGEPIYRNGEFCGFVTSAAYGFTLGKQVYIRKTEIFSFDFDYFLRSAWDLFMLRLRKK